MAGEVPPLYIPQVQIQMEVFDLDVCDFVQFRPATAFEEQALDITVVRRDRSWFYQALPVLHEFIRDLDAIREGRLDPPGDASSLDLTASLSFAPVLKPAAVCYVQVLDEED